MSMEMRESEERRHGVDEVVLVGGSKNVILKCMRRGDGSFEEGEKSFLSCSYLSLCVGCLSS